MSIMCFGSSFVSTDKTIKVFYQKNLQAIPRLARNMNIQVVYKGIKYDHLQQTCGDINENWWAVKYTKRDVEQVYEVEEYFLEVLAGTLKDIEDGKELHALFKIKPKESDEYEEPKIVWEGTLKKKEKRRKRKILD
jgi:hypothetical protein